MVVEIKLAVSWGMTPYRIFSKASDYVDKTDESAIKPQQPRSKSKSYQYSPSDVYRLLGIE